MLKLSPCCCSLAARRETVLTRCRLPSADEAFAKLGISQADLDKLNSVPLIVAFVGLLVNLLLLASMANFAWLKATALNRGQPFTAYLSLTNVQFGTASNPTVDSYIFCGGKKNDCSLGSLCAMTPDPSKWDNGSPKSTPVEAWCAAGRAGATAVGLLWLALIPGLAATAFTALYAAKEIPMVAKMAQQIEKGFGFTDYMQKGIICCCWAALWLLLFVAMTMYALMIPDTLGWGVVELEASFGLLRFSFVLVSLAGAVLTMTLFSLWKSENVAEAWMEFQSTKLLSFKKGLYLALMLQLVLYLLMIIDTVDWSALLIVLAGFYLDAKNRNFMLMYLVLVAVSILFDIVKLAGMPSFENMTPGQSFGATLWMCIFSLKFVIVGFIFAYETREKEAEVGAFSRFDEAQLDLRDDEIAE